MGDFVAVDVVLDNLFGLSVQNMEQSNTAPQRKGEHTYPEQAEINRHDNERKRPCQSRNECAK